MPIIDYKQRAELSEKNFFNLPTVSDKNKEAVRSFLINWVVKRGDRSGMPVKYSRRTIFFNHIRTLLEKTEDIRREMHDETKIKCIFAELRNKLSPAYYATVVNVSLTFVTEINDGIKPAAFKTVHNISKKAYKRNLSPEDMITWEDCEKLMNSTPSVQFKAMIATQLDGGFRPSEFIDLNYGDVQIKDDFIIIQIRDGKTGSRSVILWRSVPVLLRWLNCHPTKQKKDPLWIQEGKSENKILRYKYDAIRIRFRQIFIKTHIDKPYDFYNFRHSACVLSKNDNVPEELAASKFGHTIEYYVNTYGRLSTKDIIDRYSKHYGIRKEQETLKQNVKCRCGFINEPEAATCTQCGNPTSPGKALEQKSHTEDELKKLHDQLEYMKNDIERVKARHMVRSLATLHGIQDNDREALIKLVGLLFDKGIINPNNFYQDK